MKPFVVFVVFMWSLLVGIIGWHVWKARRLKQDAETNLDRMRRIVPSKEPDHADPRR
jgi:hypothetical protein